jgi:hypothetical protein
MNRCPLFKANKYALQVFLISALVFVAITQTGLSQLFCAPNAMVAAWFPHIGKLWIAVRHSFYLLVRWTLFFSGLTVMLPVLKWVGYEINNKKAELGIAFSATIVTLLLVEIILRVYDFVPGQINMISSFHPVDTLVLNEAYVADSNALTYIDPKVAAKLSQFLQTPFKSESEIDEAWKKERHKWLNVGHDFKGLAKDYAIVVALADNSPFVTFYRSILSKPLDQRSGYDSLILSYVKAPVNADGFRSIPFRKKGDRKRILLIGDSFTYGYTTTNKIHSFYDLLLSEGMEIYNTGLNDSDPPQYEAVAAKYIPLIKPDIVVVNFFMGNDVQYYHQKFEPYQTYNYRTNAGYLQVCPLGVPVKNINEAYQLAYQNAMIPDEGSWLNNLCRKTVIGTLVWKNVMAAKTQSSSVKKFFAKAARYHLPYPDANIRMQHIKQLCDSNHAAFILAIIPVKSNNAEQHISGVETDSLLFKGIKYYQPTQLLQEDFCQGNDDHFNEKGHAKYALFLKHIIDSVTMGENLYSHRQ